MHLNNPLMVGFGISNKATFQAACEHASGAITGSKFVTLLEEEKEPGKGDYQTERSPEVRASG